VTSIRDAGGKTAGRIFSVRNITGRKQAEEALRDSEQKYRSLVENINVGIYRATVGHKGKYIEVNPAMLKIFGYENKDELLAVDISDTYQNPDDRIKYNEKILSQGFVKNEELEMKKKDGTPITVSDTSIAVHDNKGKIVYFDGIVEDITESKQIEKEQVKALAEAAAARVAADTIDGMIDGVVVADLEGRIIQKNPASDKMFGYSGGEVIGRKLTEFIPEEEAPKALKAISELLKTGAPKRNFEFTGVRKDGNRFPILVSASVLRDEKGKVNQLIVAYRDITERKRVEEKLRESEEKYRGLVENVPDIIYSLNSKGEIVSINKTGTELLGHTEEELLGAYFSKVIFKEDLNKCATSFNELKTGKRNITRGLKFRLVTKQGKIIHSELNAKATYDEDGNLVKTEGVIRDVSLLEETMIELDKSRKELEKAYEELKNLDKMKADFLEMAAHELRTPIVAIKIYMDLIKDEKLGRINKKQKEKIGIVSKNIGQLTKIINEMIDVSRIESGKLDIRKRYISISELVKMVVDDVKTMADEKGQTIMTEIPASLPGVLGDVDLVFKAFMNLLTNAINYTPKNGSITVKVQDEERNIHIIVQDNGIGIPEEELEKIFDKFYTGSSSEHKGIGLGLTIVKGIVEQHNGKIWAESITGKGSTFHVLLPKNGGKT